MVPLGMKRSGLLLLGLLCACFARAQTLDAPLSGRALSAKASERPVVSVKSGQQLVLYFHDRSGAPLSGEVKAYNGAILEINGNRAIYQAPPDSGVDLLTFSYGRAKEKWLIDIQGDEGIPTLPIPLPRRPYNNGHGIESLEGYWLPAAGVSVFATTAQPGGVDVKFGGVPIIKGRDLRGNPCGAPKTETKTKTLQHDYWLSPVTVNVSVEIATEVNELLKNLGIKVTIRAGTTITIMIRDQRTTKIDQMDCYECRNGLIVYVGSKVEFTTCDSYSYPYSDWACSVHKLLGLSVPCDTVGPNWDCVSSGSNACKCPDSVITGGCP